MKYQKWHQVINQVIRKINKDRIAALVMTHQKTKETVSQIIAKEEEVQQGTTKATEIEKVREMMTDITEMIETEKTIENVIDEIKGKSLIVKDQGQDRMIGEIESLKEDENIKKLIIYIVSIIILIQKA